MSKSLGEYERLVCDEQRPGIELVEIHGGPGYSGERITLENGLGNGLRFLVLDIDDEGPGKALGHFHIHDPETARLIAARLLEWCERIADPPDVGAVKQRNGEMPLIAASQPLST